MKRKYKRKVERRQDGNRLGGELTIRIQIFFYLFIISISEIKKQLLVSRMHGAGFVDDSQRKKGQPGARFQTMVPGTSVNHADIPSHIYSYTYTYSYTYIYIVMYIRNSPGRIRTVPGRHFQDDSSSHDVSAKKKPHLPLPYRLLNLTVSIFNSLNFL